MKKHITTMFFTVLFLMLAMVTVNSCLSVPPASNRNKSEWVFDKDNLENRKLEKYEIAYRDSPFGLPEGKNTDLFGRIVWFNDLMSELDLHEALSLEQKQQLFSLLFGLIPQDPRPDIYRAVAIGSYFNYSFDASFEEPPNLILYLRSFTPSAKTPPDSSSVFLITANYAVFKDAATGNTRKFHSRNRIDNINWNFAAIVFQDGRFVNLSALFRKEDEEAIKTEAGGDDAMLNINLADLYIKDELKANDAAALALLEKVVYSDANTPPNRIAAGLNLFLYYLSQGDPEKAEAALLTAQTLAREVDDLDATFTQVLTLQAPVMLALYRSGSM
jgi:hypothetical protein